MADSPPFQPFDGDSTLRLLRRKSGCGKLAAGDDAWTRQRPGALIAAARKEKNLTQRELAAALHVSDRAISKWERGAGFPDISLLEPLADTLDLGVLDLLRGERGDRAGTGGRPFGRHWPFWPGRRRSEPGKRWSQALAGAVLLVPTGFILFGILATAVKPLSGRLQQRCWQEYTARLDKWWRDHRCH